MIGEGERYVGWCVSWMVGEMRRRGKKPVWAAEETKAPSMRLAARLGFVPVDGLVLLRPSQVHASPGNLRVGALWGPSILCRRVIQDDEYEG